MTRDRRPEDEWMAEAWTLIATRYDVDRDGDRERCRIDGMPVSDGQVVELAIVLGKRVLDHGDPT